MFDEHSSWFEIQSKFRIVEFYCCTKCFLCILQDPTFLVVLLGILFITWMFKLHFKVNKGLYIL